MVASAQSLEQRRARFTDALKAASPYDLEELKRLRAELADAYHASRGGEWWQLMIESRLVGALVDLMDNNPGAQRDPWWRK